MDWRRTFSWLGLTTCLSAGRAGLRQRGKLLVTSLALLACSVLSSTSCLRKRDPGGCGEEEMVMIELQTGCKLTARRGIVNLALLCGFNVLLTLVEVGEG